MLTTITGKANNIPNSSSNNNGGDGLDLVEPEDKQLVRDLLSVMAKRGLGKTYEVKPNSKGYDILTFFPDPAGADDANNSKAAVAASSTQVSTALATPSAAAASDAVTIYLDDLELLYEVNRLRVRSVAVKYMRSLHRLCVHVAVLSHKEPVMLEEQTVVMRIQKRKRWGIF